MAYLGPKKQDDGMDGVTQLCRMLRQQGLTRGVQIGQEQAQAGIDQKIAEAVAKAKAEAGRIWDDHLEKAVDDAFQEGKAKGIAETKRDHAAALVDAENTGHRKGVTDTIAEMRRQAMLTWDKRSEPDDDSVAPLPVFLEPGEGPVNGHCSAQDKSYIDGSTLPLDDIRALGARARWTLASPEIASKTLTEMGFHYSLYRALKPRGIDEGMTVEKFLQEVPLAEFVTLKFVAYCVWRDVKRVFGSHVNIEVEATD